MNPFDSIAYHAHVSHRNPIFCGYIIDGHCKAINSHLPNQIFRQFAFPVPTSRWGFSAKLIVGMLGIISLREIFEIHDSIITFVAIFVIYGHIVASWANKSLRDNPMNHHPILGSPILEVESTISSAIIETQQSPMGIAHSSHAGYPINSFVFGNREPRFRSVYKVWGLHSFNYTTE